MGYKAIQRAEAKKDLSARLRRCGLGFMQAGLLADRLIVKADHLASERGQAGDEVLALFLRAFEGDYSAVAPLGIELDAGEVEAEARKLNRLEPTAPVAEAQLAHACLQVIARS